jgi:hypothetical protein
MGEARRVRHLDRKRVILTVEDARLILDLASVIPPEGYTHEEEAALDRLIVQLPEWNWL